MNPIKLCCMRPQSEHNGVQCPDGKVMCCVCWERVDVKDLVTDGSEVFDICKVCEPQVRGIFGSPS